MACFLYPALLLYSLLPAIAWGQTIGPGEVLTLPRAIEIGLKTQPSVMAGSYTVKANEARIGEARSTYYPQMNASASYSRVSSPLLGGFGQTVVTATPGAAAVGPGANAAAGIIGLYDLYTGSVSLSQMIYDFGRTSSQVKINALTAQSSRYDLTTTENMVALNVKQAYYAALQAERNRDVARQAAKQLEEHLNQARSLFEIGTKTRFDVTQAEVNLSNAQLSLIQAENQVRLTRVNLNNAMAVPDAPDYRLEDLLLYTKFDLPLEEAVATAYARRPDLRSLAKKKEAARQSVTLAREGYLPQLNANANYYYTGTDFPLQSGWSYGLSLSIPLFNGFLTRYQVQEAQANLGVADANERSCRLTIFTQLNQDYLTLRTAAESIVTSEVAVRQARENVELATGRYRNGVGIALDVIDAIVTQGNAEVAHTQALANYKNAQAAIENDMGMR
ncbi:MAG: TolC family protein [Syntrophorhabdales bacterium]|jgi:outer membrane protein TolC